MDDNVVDIPEEIPDVHEETILESIRDYVGVQKDIDAFDKELILHINSAFSTLFQIGVGKDRPYRLEECSTWFGLFSEYEEELDLIKEYTFLKVKLLFDPPTNSSLLESLKSVINEIEYRIELQIEGIFEEDSYYEEKETDDEK